MRIARESCRQISGLTLLLFAMCSPQPAPAQSSGVAGWKSASPAFSDMYRVEVDTAIHRSGSASGHIAARNADAYGFAGLAQKLRGDGYRGKRVRFSAWIRGRGVRAGASLYVRAAAADRALDDAELSFGVGDRDQWTFRQVVFDVPLEADEVFVRVALTGPGEIWFDDAAFETVPSSVPAMNSHRVRAYLINPQIKAWWGPPSQRLMNPGLERAQ